MAGTEMVQAQPYATLLQREQALQAACNVVHQRALGQLEIEAVGWQPRLGQGARHRRLEDAGGKLARRQVHGKAQRGKSHGAPLCGLRAGVAQDPVTDRADQAAALGRADQRGCRHFLISPLPPYQRFHGGDLAGDEVDLRLVMKPQFSGRERIAQGRAKQGRGLRLVRDRWRARARHRWWGRHRIHGNRFGRVGISLSI